jgi:hypothetical protein
VYVRFDLPGIVGLSNMRLPRVQFTLRTAMFSLAGVAILLVLPGAFYHRPSDFEVFLILEAVDGDAGGLARDLVSPSVLEEVIFRPTYKGRPWGALLPSLDQATDPREELLRLVTVEASPSTRTVRISMIDSQSGQEGITLTALGEACVRVLGARRVAVLGDLDVFSKRSLFQGPLTLMLPVLWAYLLTRSLRSKRRAEKAEQLRLLQSPTTDGPA